MDRTPEKLLNRVYMCLVFYTILHIITIDSTFDMIWNIFLRSFSRIPHSKYFENLTIIILKIMDCWLQLRFQYITVSMISLSISMYEWFPFSKPWRKWWRKNAIKKLYHKHEVTYAKIVFKKITTFDIFYSWLSKFFENISLKFYYKI